MTKTADRNIIDLETIQQPPQPQQQQQHQHQYQQQRAAKSKPQPKIETQTLAGEQSSIQEEVTQLKSVITKTIENNNENVKEVEQELEKIANSHNTDFVPIIETYSEDDAIVIKPKQRIDEERRQAVAAETSENDYVIEDNTIKNHGGKLATVDIDNEQQQSKQKSMGFAAVTNRSDEPIIFTSNEFDDRNSAANHNNHDIPNSNDNSDINNNNKGIDDVTISLATPKVRPSSLIHPRTQILGCHFFCFSFFFDCIAKRMYTHTRTMHTPYNTHSKTPNLSLHLCSFHLISVQLLFLVENTSLILGSCSCNHTKYTRTHQLIVGTYGNFITFFSFYVSFDMKFARDNSIHIVSFAWCSSTFILVFGIFFY